MPTIPIRLIVLTLVFATVPVLGRADIAPTVPDAQGDYFRNEAPVKGTAPRPLMPGSLWRVTAATLNCRHQPSLTGAIVRTFQQGAIVQVEVYRGGADEVLLNVVDADGKPWMPVRGQRLADRCYVRANQRYIQPLPRS